MRPFLRALLPAAILTLGLAPNGASEAPPNLDTALTEQRSLSRQRPDDAGVWNDLGNLLVLGGDFDEAQSAYTRALELEPASMAPLFNLALLRHQRGDLEGAILDYRALLEVDPANAWCHYQLGSAYEAQGQRQLALERYAAALTLDPELLFPEKNAHIIENRLVTEALLLARRGSRSQPTAPRTYDEGKRITSILTPAPLAMPAGPADSQPEPDAEATAPAAAPQPSAAPATAPSPERRVRQDGDSAALATSGDRVLDSTDLRGSVRNQVRGEADGDHGAPAAPGTRRRAGANVTPSAGRRPSLHQPPATNGVNAFGLNSTGALEWRLGPASDQPALATESAG